MSWRARLDRLPRSLTALAFCLLAGLAVLTLRGQGALERLELGAYDLALGLRSRLGPPPPPRITLVTARESDLAALGWPVRDRDLALLLQRILDQGPRVVGLDLFRDRPEEPGHEALAALMAKEPRLMAVMKFPGPDDAGVAPPPAIADPARIGFADTLPDEDGVVRRGLLFLSGGGETRWALSLRLALAWLAPEGLGLTADPADPATPRLGAARLQRLPADPVGYKDADPGGWQMLMSWPLAPGRLPPAFSFADLLAGRVPPELIRDRIVLVAAAADSVKDQVLTPLPGLGAADGVLYHAELTAQLIGEALGELTPLLPVPPWLDRGWILLWTLLGGMAALRLHGRALLPLAALAGGLVLVTGSFLLLVMGWWLALVPPLIGGLASLLMVSLHLARRAAGERAALERLFSVHLSPAVADHLWAERDRFLADGRPRPRQQEATVLFSDIQGFTPISEGMTPEALMAWLDRYLSAMAELVARHGGMVDKFMGDGIMAVFGVPVPRPGADGPVLDARAAVACALAMDRELARLNRAFAAEGMAVVRIRIGIHKGPLVAGSIGSAERQQYTILGDTVNTAARLESWRAPDTADTAAALPPGLCEPLHSRILVSDAVCACLGAATPTVPAGAIRLKGKSRPVQVHRVLVPAASDVERGESP